MRNKNLKSVEENYLEAALNAIDDAKTYVRYALLNISGEPLEPLKPAYQTPQWHHTVLWAGFAFVIGMLIGAGLMGWIA